MCGQIDSKKVFSEFSVALKNFFNVENQELVPMFVEILSLILSSSPIFKDLRETLAGINDDTEEEREELFRCLYETWVVTPVSTLTLCLLAKKYKLAY